MYNFDMMENFNANDSKYDMPDWMVKEGLYNCEGFTADYYRSLFSKAIGKLAFWR
ncbi:MAG: hypothetical protein LUE16_10780 [Lachnospiraceae bacterium]|nr:hypothetical protein [Lachnospiraceae bacterium]